MVVVLFYIKEEMAASAVTCFGPLCRDYRPDARP